MVDQMTFCTKFSVYFVLALNAFGSFIILFLICVCTYDISLLPAYKKLYLVLALIIWLLLFCIYIAKIVLIIIGKLPKKYLRIVFISINAPALLWILIGLIYDIVHLAKKNIDSVYYPLIYWLVTIGYLICTFFDFWHLKYQDQLSSKEEIIKETVNNIESVKVENKSDNPGVEDNSNRSKSKLN